MYLCTQNLQNKMKKSFIALILLLSVVSLCAQESQTIYNFLRLPVSAHAAALGGENITIDDDDPTLIFHNPALISNVSDKSINLNYMTYMEGAKTASASFVKAYKERGTWGVAAQYMDYGSMKEVSADNIETGTFSAKDIMVMGTFTYALSNRIAGGISAKFISSTIASFNSYAVAVDLGLNYYDYDRGWSVSAVARNLGGQLKAYEDDFEDLPIDVQLGVTKRLTNSPLRFSATIDKLTDWDDDRFVDHLSFGIDVFLSESIYLAGGYNFRRAEEMKVSDADDESSHGAGLSFGGGIQLERFKLNVAYGKYHVSTSSLNFNLTYTL